MVIIIIAPLITTTAKSNNDNGEKKAIYYNEWYAQINHIERLKNPTKKDVTHLISLSKNTCKMGGLLKRIVYKKDKAIAAFTLIGIGDNSKQIKKIIKKVKIKCKPTKKKNK